MADVLGIGKKTSNAIACHWLIMGYLSPFGAHVVLFCPNMEQANLVGWDFQELEPPQIQWRLAILSFIRKG